MIVNGETYEPTTSVRLLKINNNTVEFILSGDSIPDNMFYRISRLYGVTFSEGITRIGTSAFEDCTDLRNSVVLPDSLTELGDYAFDGTKIQGVTFGSGLTAIGNNCFSSCSNLSAVTFTDNIMTIGNEAFRNTGVQTIHFGGVRTIGNYAFNQCLSLSSIVLGDNVTTIGDYAFGECTGVSGNLVIPDSVTSIGMGAFKKSTIETVTIPDSVTEMGTDIFYQCPNLVSANVNSDYIPSQCFFQCFVLSAVTIGSNTSYISNKSFYECRNLSTVSLGANVSTIGDYAFYDCRYITSLSFPDSLRSIGSHAFVACERLVSIDLGTGVTTIGERAFQNVPLSGTLEIPSSVSVMQANSFSGTSITNLVIGDGNKTMNNAFQYCSRLTDITIGNNVSTIGDYAFTYCDNLTGVTIGSGTTEIGKSTFAHCPKLINITIDSSPAPSLYYYTFNGVATGGTLNYPYASDYSTWLSQDEYYLGYYNWNGIGIKLISDLPPKVKEQTDTTFTVTYLTGKTVNFNTPDDIIITEGQTVDNGNGTQTTTYQIYINEEYTATTATIIITDGENTISKTITVEEKEDPMAAPTISINRYADLAFPQSGATKYITITYTNTSTSYISTPYSSEPDVTISQESVTVTDNGVEIYYGIHVPATQYERNIPLIFSCSSPEGSSATETFTGLQDGDARPEGLTLSSTAGSFAAEGESKYITVTYPSGKELNVSVSSSTGVIPIRWCTATSDGTTGGSTVYTITMTANEFTESRTALVNFSYQADGGEYITAQYVAVQAAAGGAGEESSLSLYRTVMNFSADGVFDFGAAVCKADYRWTEEVDIDEPEVDVSWIVVSEGEHQTGAGYIIVPWGIAVARNTSTSSRTGTVTFSSVGNDDIMHTAVLTVTQEGSGGGEGQEPEGVNLIWKDLPVELPDDDMVYELLDENYDVFFRGRSAKRPSDEANRFYLNRIMQDYIYMDEIPELVATTGTVRHHDNAMKTVRIDYDGIIGATPAYNFKYDWSYTYDSPFILSESIIPYFVQGQRLLITCCNINDNNPQTDTYSFISGGQVQSGSISADAHDYKTMSVAVPSNTDVILLGGQRYEVLRSCQYRYVLYYLSPKGGWCWFPVMGRVNKRDNVTQYSYTKNYDNQTAEFGKSRYLAEIGTKYELNTGWLREHESLRMWEVLETNMAYLHDLYEDKVIPVIMTDETVEHKNKARDRKLISYSFNVEASQPKVRF